MSLEQMTDCLSGIQADWIAGGSTATPLGNLPELAQRGWNLRLSQREPLTVHPRSSSARGGGGLATAP